MTFRHQQAVFLAFLFACIFVIARSTNYLTAIPGDLLDPRFNSFILEHVSQWMRGGVDHLWSPPFFYPFDNLLAFSDNHFGSVIVYALFRTLNFSREQSTTLWIACGTLLNFLASYWVLRKWSFNVLAAGAGAFVFTSSLPVLGWEEYSQLTYRFAIPLAIYNCQNFLQRQNLNSLLWCLIWICEQFFCSIYLGYFLSIFLLCWVGAYWALCFRSLWASPIRTIGQKRRWSLLLTGLTVLVGLACLAMLWKYHFVARQYSLQGWSTEKILGMLPTPASYLLADQSLLSGFIGNAITTVPWRHPQQLFLGIGVTIFFIFGLLLIWLKKFWHFRPLPASCAHLGKIACLSLVTLWLLSIRFNEYSLYLLLLKLPGVSAIQFVTRIILVMLWPIAIIVAIACNELWQAKTFSSITSKAILTIATLIFLCSESFFYQASYSPHSWWQERLSSSKELIHPPLLKDSILHAKARINEFESMSALDAMMLSQELHIPTFSGYSGNIPFGKSYAARDACHDVYDRLEDFASFKKISSEQVMPLAKRASIMDADSIQSFQNLNLSPAPVAQVMKITNTQLPSSLKLICGWDLEHWGAWANHRIARLVIAIPQEQFSHLLIDATTAHASQTNMQKVDIYLNGIWITQVSLPKNTGNRIQIPFEQLTQQLKRPHEFALHNAILEFHTHPLITPEKLGISKDSRALGIGITSYQFQ